MTPLFIVHFIHLIYLLKEQEHEKLLNMQKEKHQQENKGIGKYGKELLLVIETVLYVPKANMNEEV